MEKGTVLNELLELIRKDDKSRFYSRGYVELQMDKYVHDEEDGDFPGDLLEVYYPHRGYYINNYRVKPMFAKDETHECFEFDTIEEIATWIANTYF